MVHNQYTQALQGAQRDTARKRAEHNPVNWNEFTTFLDEDDLYLSRKAQWGLAKSVFRSLPSSADKMLEEAEAMGQSTWGADTPLAALTEMFELALIALDVSKITHMQMQALELEQEAIAQGVNPARYIAKELNIAVVSAYQRLQRAKSAKTHKFTPRNVIMIVKVSAKNTPRVCAIPACDTHTPSGDKPLCSHHQHEFLTERKFTLFMPEERVYEYIDKSHREHYYTVRKKIADAA